MRFLHIADLHLGKIVNDFSMLEDQKYILEQIMKNELHLFLPPRPHPPGKAGFREYNLPLCMDGHE